MAVKGEVGFEAEGERYVLVFDFNALCAVESELGIAMKDIGEVLSASPATIRSVFRIALAARHGKLTDFDAGAIIGAVGLTEAAGLLAQAIKAAFPEAKGAAADATENPPKPRGGSKRR